LQELDEGEKKKILDIIYILGRIGPEARRAVPTIATYLDNPDVDYRITSATALGSIGPAAKNTVHSLSRLLFDENAQVSKAALRSLEQINNKDARKAIEEFNKLNLK
jgi:HEAT repeat protein